MFDVLYPQIGGFDTHSDEAETLRTKFEQIDGALAQFVAETNHTGVWDDLAVVTVSDFGRTLTSNGRGSDHGWGGHHWVAGGKVRGNQILGSYPTDMTAHGHLNVGRGRIIPTTPWEGMWHGIAEWFGVDAQADAAAMKRVLPNLGNFPPEQMIRGEQMFEL